MTKLLLEPKSNLKLIEHFDGIILGLKGYSVGYDIEMTIEELESFIQQHPNKSVFVVMNKNLMNEELDNVLSILKMIETMNVEGIFFYDLAILYMKQQHNLNINLVWNQTHMVTNYNTCNYYNNEGCKYAYLSQEITLEEMLEIISKSTIKTIVKVFGHSVMAHSKRKLLSNYFKHIGKAKKKESYMIAETNLKKEYIVEETDEGTTIFNGSLVNGVKPSFALNGKADYFVLEEQQEGFKELIDVFEKIIKGDIELEEALKITNECYPTATEGFFYTKTIYKVKSDETN